MKKIREIVKALVMSIAALTAGFAAISLPFKLFDELSADAMRYLFIGELCVYFVIAMLYIVKRERVKAKKAKEAEKRIARREKFQRAQEEYYSLAA